MFSYHNKGLSVVKVLSRLGRSAPPVARCLTLPALPPYSNLEFKPCQKSKYCCEVYTRPAVHKLRFIRTTAWTFDEYKTIITPPFAESISEGDIKWEKAVGDFVQEDEVIAEIETDKTAIPIPAPVSGILEELFVSDGDKVVPGDNLCKIKLTGAPTTATTNTTTTDTTSTSSTTTTTDTTTDTRTTTATATTIGDAPPPQPSPAVSGPIPATPPPVPPIPSGPMDVVKPAPAPSVPITDTKLPVGSRTERRVKMSRMRQRIAQRLKDAQNEYAMLTTFNEVDMSNIIELRKTHQDAFVKKHGIKVGFMSPFFKAACYALQNMPVVNAVIDGEEILYRDYVDISFAVATPKGLLVPVVRNVETMNFADIEKEIHRLGEKAREGNLPIEDMDGGTFTISNGGVFGSLFGTPIINPPQSAILGMHGVFDRPVAINGKVEIRPMMYVAITYDHRLMDGRDAVTFLRIVKKVIEDPRVLLLDV